MDRNCDCDNIIASIIQDERHTKKKEPFAFSKRKRNDVAWLNKTRNNCIKFHIIYAEEASQFFIVDSKMQESMQQANHKNNSSIAFKNKKLWKDFWC